MRVSDPLSLTLWRRWTIKTGSNQAAASRADTQPKPLYKSPCSSARKKDQEKEDCPDSPGSAIRFQVPSGLVHKRAGM